MENTLDTYFDIARNAPVSISLAQVETTIAGLALAPSPSILSKLLTKNSIIMTSISGIIITSAVFVSGLFSGDQPEVSTSAIQAENLATIERIEIERIVCDPMSEQMLQLRENSILISNEEKQDEKQDGVFPIADTVLSVIEDSSALMIEDSSENKDLPQLQVEQIVHNDESDSIQTEKISTIINAWGKEARGFDSFDGFYYNDETWAKVKKDGKYGMINQNQQYVVSPIYNKIDEGFYYNDNKWCLVKRDGKYGFIDQEGKEVVEAKYKRVWDFYENNEKWAKVKRNRRYFFIDRNGNEIRFGPEDDW